MYPRATTRKFLDELTTKLGYRKEEDFYKLTKAIVIKNGGKKYLAKYDNSLTKTLQQVYPEHHWIPWKFDSPLPKGFWDNLSNQRYFFDWLGKYLGFKSKEDYYKLTRTDIEQNGGISLLGQYNNSIFNAISTAYPEYDWLPWKFGYIPKFYWDDIKNRRKFLDWLGNFLGYKTLEDWYNLNTKILHSLIHFHGAQGLLANQNSIELLQQCYHPHEFLPWKLHQTDKQIWLDEKNRRIFFENIANRLNFKSLEDWYNISSQTLSEYGASTKPPFDTLKQVFPEHGWVPWRFSTCPQYYWENQHNIEEFIHFLENCMSIKKLDDWYRISINELKRIAPSSFMSFVSIENGLRDVYPTHPWDTQQFFKVRVDLN